MATVDASNSCIPPSHPLVASVPPLPLATRGEPLVLHGKPGRINSEQSLLLYTSGKLVVVRDLTTTTLPLVYRGHQAPVTVAKFSPSGAYIASGDARGKLRVWSYDTDEHLPKLNLQILAGPICDVDWDFESKRIVVVGQAQGECARVIQWDTGVSCGTLGQYSRGRASTCALKPNRPMRIVTGSGMDDATLHLNSGPPFQRVLLDEQSSSEQQAQAPHTKAINCVRYNPDGTMVASVSSDKSVCLLDGKTLVLQTKLQHVHHANIYACDWSSCGKYLITCSADGTVKILSVSTEQLCVVHTYENMYSTTDSFKVPLGGMQMGCAFCKDNVPVSVALNGQITIWPKPACLLMGGDDSSDPIVTLTGHTAPIAGFAISQSNYMMYTGDTDGVLVKWNVADCRAISRFEFPQNDDDAFYKIHMGAVSAMTVVGDDTVLSVGWDDVVRVSTLDGTVLPEKTLQLESQPNAIVTGTNLVVVCTVGGLLLIKDGAMASDLIPLDYAALSVCLSSDDTTLYVGGDDCKIHVYSVVESYSKLEQVLEEGGHLKPIHALALSPDGSKLASADVRDVCVFDTTGGLLTPIVSKSRWCFHTQRVTCLSWYNQELLASGGADDSIYLWNLARKTKRIHYAFSHRGGVTGLEFLTTSDDDSIKLVSVGVDACVNQWDVTKDVAEKFG